MLSSALRSVAYRKYLVCEMKVRTPLLSTQGQLDYRLAYKKTKNNNKRAATVVVVLFLLSPENREIVRFM